MSKGINKAFLLGHVGKDPDIRSTDGGSIVASLSLATGERQKDGQGNWQDKTEWHYLVAFNRTAEIIRDYVRKGSQLMIEGKIQTRSWDDRETGEKKYRTEIFVYDVTLWAAMRKTGTLAVAGAMPEPQALGMANPRMAGPTPTGTSRPMTSRSERTINAGTEALFGSAFSFEETKRWQPMRRR